MKTFFKDLRYYAHSIQVYCCKILSTDQTRLNVQETILNHTHNRLRVQMSKEEGYQMHSNNILQKVVFKTKNVYKPH